VPPDPRTGRRRRLAEPDPEFRAFCTRRWLGFDPPQPLALAMILAGLSVVPVSGKRPLSRAASSCGALTWADSSATVSSTGPRDG
jgi:hypothetical protein